MKYTKQPLTFEEQADLLILRGLEADKTNLIHCLQTVNYYRLSGYFYPFRQPDENFAPGTTLDAVWRRYRFDRQLRILVLDGIERCEVAMRTQVAYHLAHSKGAFGYTAQSDLPNLNPAEFNLFLNKMSDNLSHSSEVFVSHFIKKYGDFHSLPPLWMIVETMSFGQLYTLVRGVHVSILKKAAHTFGLPDRVLLSWLGALNAVRNMCAHHSRLWNRQLGFRPMIPHPRQFPDWHAPIPPADRLFCILLILRFLMKVAAPNSRWKDRVEHLITKEFDDIPIRSMGFPSHWMNHPVWK